MSVEETTVTKLRLSFENRSLAGELRQASEHVSVHVAGDLGMLLQPAKRVFVPVFTEQHAHPELVPRLHEYPLRLFLHTHDNLELVLVFGEAHPVDQTQSVPVEVLVVGGDPDVDPTAQELFQQ